MIINCPSCSARFTVPDGAITPEGRVVRCSKCSHVWTEFPPTVTIPRHEDNFGIAEDRPHKPPPKAKDDKKPKKAAPAAKARSGTLPIKLPAKLQGAVNPQTLPITAAVFTWLVLGAVALISSPAWAPYVLPAQMTEEAMRMISLDNIQAQRSGEELIVSGQLHNLTASRILLPELNISVKAQNGDPIFVGTVEPPQREIAPQASLDLKVTLQLPEEARLNQGEALVQFAKVPRKLDE